MIGEARYVVDELDPSTCEFAIAVAEPWQGSGLARALLDRLERQAAASGIRLMTADTLLANGAMLALAARAGFAAAMHPHDAALARLEKHLDVDPGARGKAALPPTRADLYR